MKILYLEAPLWLGFPAVFLFLHVMGKKRKSAVWSLCCDMFHRSNILFKILFIILSAEMYSVFLNFVMALYE